MLLHVGVHVLLVKSGGHLCDHAAYRTASSAESLPLSASALLAALYLGFIPAVDVDFYAQLLRRSSVAPTTIRAYEIGVREFETYARNHKRKLKSGSAVDEALVMYGAAMYELGEDAGLRTDLQLPAKNLFPKAARALKGFFRMVPSKARDPLPWLVLVLFCDCWLSLGAPLLDAAALLAQSFWIV